MQRERTADRAEGKWHSILGGLGVSSRALNGRHGPCPLCGGKDRFRFDDKGGRGTWICNQCGAGDGMELVKRHLSCDFKEAAAEVDKYLGDEPASTQERRRDNDGQKRKLMADLWMRVRPITIGDFAGQYLNARTGLTEFPGCLRFSPDERYSGPPSSFHPAMIAKVDPSDAAAADGAKAALHRTYLSKVGTKAEIEKPRMALGAMPVGAAVRLMQHEEVLGIAEGIETALSASALFNVPCWAALNAGLLEQWSPPENVTSVFVFGDNDGNLTGQAAAFNLAKRLSAKKIHVIVEIPKVTGQDWNDVHMRQLEAAA